MPPHDYTPALDELSLNDNIPSTKSLKAPAPIRSGTRPRYESYFSQRGKAIGPGGIR